MLTVQEARARILSGISPLPPVEIPLGEASGAVLAQDVRAGHDLPRFANSAMDGYAVRRADVNRARRDAPVALRLLGEVRAGIEARTPLDAGTCLRIMTGAPIPPGADAVVPIEEAEESGDEVTVLAPPPSGGHVRPAGEDVRSGEVVLKAGIEIGPGELALLASLGVTPLLVAPRPQVAVVVTGDELVSPEGSPGPGQIRDSNTLALSTLVEEAGGVARTSRVVSDDLDDVVSTLQGAAEGAHLVISAGGVSVGRYDFVKEAVEQLGRIDLWRVAMQPGKPVVSGAIGEVPFLGLPGNPVSIHVGFEQFVRPVLRRLRGCRSLLRPVLKARITEAISKKPGRLHFIRVRLRLEGGALTATPTGRQGSHIQSSLVDCHGVALFGRDETRLDPGDEVDVEVWKLPGGHDGPQTTPRPSEA